ncbi:hypothetical protein ERJ75_001315500 [Trypanosoma vivax]|nr:hypothetical protein ERJ75_001315500 [Trypanosoma vivax]
MRREKGGKRRAHGVEKPTKKDRAQKTGSQERTRGNNERPCRRQARKVGEPRKAKRKAFGEDGPKRKCKEEKAETRGDTGETQNAIDTREQATAGKDESKGRRKKPEKDVQKNKTGHRNETQQSATVRPRGEDAERQRRTTAEKLRKANARHCLTDNEEQSKGKQIDEQQLPAPTVPGEAGRTALLKCIAK